MPKSSSSRKGAVAAVDTKMKKEHTTAKKVKKASSKKSSFATVQDFPRGGANPLTPLEYKEVAKQAGKEADLFAEEATSVTPTTTKKRKSTAAAGDDVKTKKHAKKSQRTDAKYKSSSNKLEKTVDGFTFKRLDVGSIVYGQLVSIDYLDLTVSLANNVTAYCPITAISSAITAAVERAAEADDDDGTNNSSGIPDLSRLFHVGQWVRGVVTGLRQNSVEGEKSKKRRIEIALNPTLVNAALTAEDLVPGLPLTASVKSQEDHGYVLDLGVTSEKTAFLSSSDAAVAVSQYNDKQPLSVGQLVNCAIISVTKDGRTVKVTADPEKIIPAVLSKSPSKMASILPGVLTTATVKHIYGNGLVCTLFDIFTAHVDVNHLKSPIVSDVTTLQDSYKVGEKIQCRIIHVNTVAENKSIQISLAPHIIKPSTDVTPTVSAGTILDRVVIRRVDTSGGVLCQIEDKPDILGYVHISKISDDHVDTLSATSGAYRTGSIHSARATSYSAFDKLLVLTMQKSILEGQWLRIQDVLVGSDIQGTIKAVIPQGALIAITDRITALCPSLHLSDIELSHPEKKFKEGTIVNARVLVSDPAERKILVTMKKSLLISPYPVVTKYEDVEVGSFYHGVIIAFCSAGCIVKFYNNVRALAPNRELSESFIANPADVFNIGQVVRCRVISASLEDQRIRVSFNEDSAKSATKSAAKEADLRTPEDFKVGDLVGGMVTNVAAGMHVIVKLSERAFGRVHIADITDDSEDDPTTRYSKFDRVSACVVNLDKPNKQINLSFRPSVIAKAQELQKKSDATSEVTEADLAGRLTTFADVSFGAILDCYVKRVADNGLYVWITRSLMARIKITDVSDQYIKDWKSGFGVGQRVKGKVIDLDNKLERIGLSLKPSVVDPENNLVPTNNLADLKLKVKQIVEGEIQKITAYGVFIRLDNSRVNGLCHISHISDGLLDNIEKIHRVGERVKAVVTKLDLNAKKLSLSMNDPLLVDNKSTAEDDSEVDKMEQDSKEGEQASDVDMNSDDDDAVVESKSDVDKSADTLETIEADESDAETSTLDVKGSFHWNDSDDDESDNETKAPAAEDSDSNEDGANDRKKKKKKKQLSGAALLAKAKAEADAADAHHRAPTVAADFERLVAGSPNSSFIYVKFMAFQLQLAEIDKARAVAERALKTINYREEQERMNMWVALMNLENQFGDDATLNDVVKRAAEALDPKAVYLQLVNIFEKSEKYNNADKIFKILLKKFGTSSKVWTTYGSYKLQRDDLEGARELLQRCIKSLPKRKHIKTICKFAQLEYKHGDAERGRTIFEGIVSSHPKRVDLWSVYIDQELRIGDKDFIRRLFQRVIKLKISSKKMKFFFKKWLTFERAHGDEASQTAVKEAALKYVESQT